MGFTKYPIRSFSVFKLALYLLLFTAFSAQAGFIKQAFTIQATKAEQQQSVSDDPERSFGIGVRAYQASDYQRAAQIFIDLAKSGHKDAQFYIAVMYDAGNGVEEDHIQSAMWYQKAAENGHNEAQYNLAVAYATGDGMPKNIRKAIYWMKKSALGGNIDSQYNLGLIYILGQGVKTNPEEGIQWWRLAAKNGDVIAQYNLGMMYLQGRGVKTDICEASRWWLLSARKGFSQSVQALQNLKLQYSEYSCISMVSIQ